MDFNSIIYNYNHHLTPPIPPPQSSHCTAASSVRSPANSRTQPRHHLHQSSPCSIRASQLTTVSPTPLPSFKHNATAHGLGKLKKKRRKEKPMPKVSSSPHGIITAAPPLLMSRAWNCNHRASFVHAPTTAIDLNSKPAPPSSLKHPDHIAGSS
jgi:hypothetical protein